MDRTALIRRAAASLLRAAEEAEEGRRLELKGPFTRAKHYTLQGHTVFKVEVEDVPIDNMDFAEAAAGPVGQEHVEDFRGPYHTFYVDADFSYTSPEPSVGWTGGTELESWNVFAIDGVLLKNPEDRKAASALIEGDVPSYQDDWIRSYVDYVSDPGYD